MAIVTKTITFSSDGFTDSKPSFFEEISEYYKGVKFSNTGVTIGSFSTDYGYIDGLTITFNGTAPYAGVSFQSPPPNTSPFAVGMNTIDGFFMPFSYGTPLPGYDIKLTNGVPVSPLIIVNGDPNNLTDKLQILLSVGVKYNVDPDDANSITISYDCLTKPLYSGYTGLHVYSPYDSINTPKLHTWLYSKINPNLWDIGTIVWCSPWFDKPALQYYYGYVINDKVYKVGGPIDRSFGTKKIYHISMSLWRKWWNRGAKVKVEIEGPQSYYHSDDDTIDACVDVILTSGSTISEVINKASIPPPTEYKYWMGYDSTTKQLSNDDFFAKWVFNQDKFYPITGFQHMVIRLAAGVLKSTDWMVGADANVNWGDLVGQFGDKWAVLAATGVPIAYSIVYTVTHSFFHLSFMPNLFEGIHHGWFAYNAYIAGSTIPVFWLIGLGLLTIGLLYSIFSQKRKTLIERCKIFLGEYTSTPYIELGSVLSRIENMGQIETGYFCDGAYFYTQPTTSGVTVKELSSTNALVLEDPIQQQFLESVPCDDPTLVTLFHKLLFLPYVSGIPYGYDGTVYYSEEITCIVPLTDCAELLITPPTQEYILPAGYVISFISQIDADTQANAVADDDVSHLVTGAYNYGALLSEANLGVLDSYFTHEIRVETTPTTCTIFYNNTDQLGPIVGRKVFFDMEGRYEVLNGYYSTDDNIYFRIFYKVINSFITNRYIMIASNSTTVQGMGGVEDTLSVMTNNLSYSSNWYIQSLSQIALSNRVNQILSNRCFDPNGLYGDADIVRGYYDSANNHFYLYADNYANYTLSEAPADYYLPLIEWIDEDIFEYSPILSISIDIEEICLPQTEYVNALYGFYVIGSSSGNITPLFNEVNLTVDVYVGGVFRHTYTVTTNESGKTYVSYDGYVLDTEGVSLIVITSINGSSPISIVGHITYLIGTFVSCTQPPNPLTTGLEACWNFEEASAPLLDSTANHNDLVQTTDVDFQQPGMVGSYCINLPLATSLASTETSDTLALQTFSISVWVNCVGTTMDPPRSRIIFSKVSGEVVNPGYPESGGYDIAVNPAYGGVFFHRWNWYGSADNTTGNTTAVNDGNWHHIVATYVGGRIKIYHNTVLEVNEIMAETSPIPYGSIYVPATVGSASHHFGPDIFTYPLKGSVDALAIWNRVLTPYEVQILYNDGNGLACP